MDSKPASAFERLLLIGAIVVHITTAWYSTGYHSEDEHHQTIGFAEAWRGELPPGERAWEYDARIRGTALPWIAVGVFKAADAAGIADPFNKAFLLRLLTAALAIACTLRFLRAVRGHVSTALWKPFLVITWGLWFLPFLHVRFASETWSGLMMMLALAVVLDRGRGRWWAVGAGACIALAIWIRPPVALIAAGLMTWLVLVRKEERRNLLAMLGGGMTVILLTCIADTFFYGTPTCSILRYGHIAFAGDPDHPFDALPWYYHAPWIFKYAIPPIGACILIAFGLLLWKEPKHVLVWCILPFLVVHTFIPHKEVRFLYPLAELVPWVLVAGFAVIRPMLSKFQSVVRAVVVLLAGFNVPGLLVIATTPAGNGRADLARAICADMGATPARIAYLSKPEETWRIALPHFYRPENVVESTCSWADLQPGLPSDTYLIAYNLELKGLAIQQEQLADPTPDWSTPWLALYQWSGSRGPLGVYRVPKP
jgi:phosphatidylinositol glycan class B